jgi:L-rhamnose mutarotase
MIREAVLFPAKPGMATEYERRHNPIWPELEVALKEPPDPILYPNVSLML